jgi:ribonuclease PH
MPRHDGRRPHELRPVKIKRGYTKFAAGSVLMEAGDTRVLCTASWEPDVPKWKKGSGTGWVTAEYDMLPGATSERRNRSRLKVDGRTQEIQRLIGRSLRAVVDMAALGENSILIDCDVLQADGGTRTAAITGAFIALCDAVNHAIKKGHLESSPVVDEVAAVSVGVVDGKVLTDLDYSEDVRAEVDFNVVMTGQGRYIELQGTAEGRPFDGEQLGHMLKAAGKGIGQLIDMQRTSLGGLKGRAQKSGKRTRRKKVGRK